MSSNLINDKEIAFKPNKLFLHKKYNWLISFSSILSTRVDFYEATKALIHGRDFSEQNISVLVKENDSKDVFKNTDLFA